MRSLLVVVLVCVSIIAIVPITNADYFVTTPGFYYSILGGPVTTAGRNPTLTIKTGSVVTFHVNARASHPIYFSATTENSIANVWPHQEPQTAVAVGDITVTFTTPGTMYYICLVHGFFGQINVVDNLLIFSVSTPGFYYHFEGMTGEEHPPQSRNPTITVHSGTTVIFNMTARASHPLVVSETEGAGAEDNIFAGQEPAIPSSIVPLVLTLDEPMTLYYTCTVHLFGGTLRVVGSRGNAGYDDSEDGGGR